MSDRLLGDRTTVKWCPVHISTFDQHEDPRCMWDRLAGPRPGRGACEKVTATVIVGYDIAIRRIEADDE